MEASETKTQPDEGVRDEPEDVSDTEDQSVYFVCVPGTAFGTSVFAADSEQDAANQYAVSAGMQPVPDEKGNDTQKVAVLELNSVSVDYDAVKEILNPKE